MKNHFVFFKILKVFHFYLKGQTLIWFRSRTQKLVSFFLVSERLPLLMPLACMLAFFVPAFNLPKKTDLNMHFYQDGVDLTEVKKQKQEQNGQKENLLYM